MSEYFFVITIGWQPFDGGVIHRTCRGVMQVNGTGPQTKNDVFESVLEYAEKEAGVAQSDRGGSEVLFYLLEPNKL